MKNRKRIIQNRASKLARNKARESQRRKAAAGGTSSFEERYGVSRAAVRAAPLRRVLVSGSLFKPLYVNGPSHNERKARSIVAHLAARLGPDGFHYLVSLDGAPRFADE